MWCDRCQSDVKADATASGTTLRCQQCGAIVAENPQKSDAVRQARAILERWKSSDLLDRISATESLPPLVWSTGERGKVVSKISPTAADSAPVTVADATVNTSHAPDAPVSHEAANQTDALSTANEVNRPSETNSAAQQSPDTHHALGTQDIAAAQAEPAVSPIANSTSRSEHPTSVELESSDSVLTPKIIADKSSHPGQTTHCASAPESPANSLLQTNPKSKEVATAQLQDNPNALKSDQQQPTGNQNSNAAPWLTTTVDLSVGDDFDKPVNYTSASENVITRLQPRRSNQLQQLEPKAIIKSEKAGQDSVQPANAATSSMQIHPTAGQQVGGTTGSAGLQEGLDQPSQFALPANPDSAEKSAAIVAQDESVRDRAETAETRVPAELAPCTTPKKLIRQPPRRPPLKRRSGPARIPTSSTGPVTVNRKFRVDQPGGKDTEDLQSLQPSSASDSPGQPSPVPSSTAPETKLVSNASPASASKRFRIDAAESIKDLSETDGSRTRTHNKPKRRYIDEPHGSAPRGPHFEISPPKRSNLTSMTGQFLAYLGVLGLTIGTAIVIYGHFGGYSEYTPTGWLVTTVAQMLLFLGVINLVSGGIEQNNEEVSRRINTLGEQLLRIESVTEEVLRGPKISPRRYMDPDSADARTSQRETAEIE